MELFTLFGRLAINGANEAERELDNVTETAERSENRMTKAFKKIGAAIAAAFAVSKIKDFGTAIVKASAEVNAEASAFVQIMGKYSDEASAKVQKIADATGTTASRLTPYMTSMSAKFKGLGYNIEDATDYATRGLNLAADAAAFWDKSLNDSMSALNSFINGSYEGGEAIGLFANDTQMAQYAVQNSIIKSAKDWATLDEKTKQATRLEYAENMMRLSGATGQAAKESGQYQNVMANLTEAWRQFKAQIGEPLLQNIVIPAMKRLGDFITNTLSPGFENLKAKVKQLSDFYKEHKDAINAAATAIGVLTGAILTYNAYTAITNKLLQKGTIWSKLWSTAIALATGKIKLAAIAQKALNLVMSMNPVGLVVAAIAALVAVFVIAYKKSETFREAVQQLLGKLKALTAVIWEQLKPVFDELIDVFQALWEFVEAAVIPMFKEIIDAVIELWNIIKPIIETLWPVVRTVLQNILRAVTTNLQSGLAIVKTALNAIKNVINLVTALIEGDWSKAWEAVKNIFSGIWSGIKNIAANVLNGIKNQFLSMFNGVKKIVEKLKNLFNFKWNLPKLKLPHFKISGKFSLVPPSVPKLKVDWYKDGGILTQPTAFGVNPATGALRVGGEAGDEAVAPIDTLLGYIKTVVQEETGGMAYTLQRLIDMLAAYFPQLIKAADKNVVLDDGTLVGVMTPKINVKLAEIQNGNRRGR